MSTPQPVANLLGARDPEADAMIRVRLAWSIEMVGNPPRLSHLSPQDRAACVEAVFDARGAGIDVHAVYALVAPPEQDPDLRKAFSDEH